MGRNVPKAQNILEILQKLMKMHYLRYRIYIHLQVILGGVIIYLDQKNWDHSPSKKNLCIRIDRRAGTKVSI